MTADYPMLPLAIGAAAAYLAATFAGSLMVRRGFPIPGGKNRIGCIDGLRGYLAISVLIHHFIIWTQITRLGGTWAAPSVNAFNHLGAGGVALFFMTTGLVFYPRILTGFVATSWLATYTTRIFRIMPLVFFSLLVIIAIIYLRHGYTTGSPFIISAARWLTSWGEPDLLGYADSGRLNAYVLWSLWYEWVFYFVVLPLCAVGMDLIRGRAPSWALPVAFLLTALAARLVFSSGLATFLPLFAVGMLAFECQQRPSLRQFFGSKPMGLVAIICLAVAMVSAPTPFGLPQLTLYGVFFIAVACGNSLFGLLRTKGALLLGECSFGIYLLHGIVLDLLFVNGAAVTGALTTEQLPLLLPVAAFVVACITALVFIYIERPFIRVGSSLAKRFFRRGGSASIIRVAKGRVAPEGQPGN